MARFTWVFAVGGAHEESLGDLVVAEPGGDQGHDLALAVGEEVEVDARPDGSVGSGRRTPR